MPSSNFHVMAKPIGPICNLDCKYCFYLEKESLYPQVSKWAMREEVLESYIRQYIEAHDTPVVNFAWQGGEPTLLGVEYFRGWSSSRRNTRTASGSRTPFRPTACCSTTTWAALFRENDFLIGISIDGPRELHDAYRVDKGGQPTFDRVMRGMETLKRNGVEFNTLTTVHRANADSPLEVYRFLKENGSGFMQFIPIVERDRAPGHRGRPATDLAGFSRRGAGGAVVGRAAPVRPLPLRHLRRVGAQGCRPLFCAALRRQPGVVVGHGGEPVRLPPTMRRGAGHRAQRRPVLLRSLRVSRRTGSATSWSRRWQSLVDSAQQQQLRRGQGVHACRATAASAMCALPATASAPSTAFSPLPMASRD